jgi:hypothetical protein
MFGDKKLKRAVDAQAKVNALMLEQSIDAQALIRGLHERVTALETQHIGLKYALAALATVIRNSSSENRDTLTGLLDIAITALSPSLQKDEEFCAGIRALQDEKTFSITRVST